MASARILSIFWHNVEGSSISADSVNPSTQLFDEHLKFLTTHYTPISICEFLRLHEQKESIYSYTKPPLLLGFDDGFKNVVRYALPILTEFKAPAVFFVIGEILKNPAFVPWYVERKHLIRKSLKKTVAFGNRRLNLDLGQDRSELVRWFDASYKRSKSENERQSLLNNFAEMLGLDRPRAVDLDEDLKFVDGKDLASLPAASLLTVASHAMTHRDLAILTYDEQVAELEQSDFLLRRRCPSYYPVIAYPNGSFTKDTMGIARRIYKAAFAVLLSASYRNLYAYPRIGLENASVPEVAYIISPNRRKYLLPLKRALHVTGIRPL